mmetsp:Transcript_69761/g.192899  ORF Transcript_69761/g.192899 Transcript_69761/m.192899 type:complete len:228 (-) Transcript_69761:716-1399(-)
MGPSTGNCTTGGTGGLRLPWRRRSERNESLRSQGSEALHVNQGLQVMDHLDEVLLIPHDLTKVLVGHRCLVLYLVSEPRVPNDSPLLHVLDEVLFLDASEGTCSRHRPPCSMGARLPRIRLALAAHDVRTRSHAPRDDPQLPHLRARCALPSHPEPFLLPAVAFSIVETALLALAVVVMYVNHFAPDGVLARLRLEHPCECLHHELPVLQRIGLAECHVGQVLLARF